MTTGRTGTSGKKLPGLESSLMPQPMTRTANGAAIRYVRSSANCSAREVALAVGISQSYLSRIESGTRQPAEDILDRLARFFGVDVAVISVSGPAAKLAQAGVA